jgi:hypothetical protein
LVGRNQRLNNQFLGGSGYISRFALSDSFPGGTNAGDGKVIITT